MDKTLYELQEPFECTCFVSSRNPSSDEYFIQSSSLERDHNLRNRRGIKSHEGKNQRKDGPIMRSQKTKTSLKRGNGNHERQESQQQFRNYNQSENGRNFQKKINEQNSANIKWGVFNQPMTITTLNRLNNEDNSANNTRQRQFHQRYSQYRTTLNSKNIQPVYFTNQQLQYGSNISNKYQTNYRQFNAQHAQNNRIFQNKQMHYNTSQLQIPINKETNANNTIRSSKKFQDNYHSSKISLTNNHNRVSQYSSNQPGNISQYSKKDSYYESQQRSKNQQQCLYNDHQRGQSFRMYMKQIESIVDQNQFDDQISQVIERGIEFRHYQMNADLDNIGKQQKLKTLPTVASNIQNSGTAHSFFGMNSNHSKKF